MTTPFRLHASAGHGPLEVRRFVLALAPALVQLVHERGLAHVGTIEQLAAGGARSVTLLLVGPADLRLGDLLGTHELIDESRRARSGRHRGARKRFFASLRLDAAPPPAGPLPQLDASELEWSFARSGGPGGQHVNTSATAVRLLHRPSGVAVRVGEGRSQHHNRTLALQRLAERLAEQQRAHAAAHAATQRHGHYRLERGNAVARWRWSTREPDALEREPL
jgi:protein subunit release factor B